MASKKFMPLQRSIKKRASRLAKRQIDTFFRNLDGECENTGMGYEIIGEQCENVGRVERSDLESDGNANQFMEGEDCSPLQSDFEGCSSPSATPSVPESDEDSIFGGHGSSDPVYQTEENCGERRELSLRTQLAQWSVDYGITLEATSALLKILKPLHPHLPKTAESLRLTKKRKVPVKKLDNGSYAHLGLINGIKKFSKVRELEDATVLFDISFDGFPIYKSASTECWPILARCNQLGIREPFPLGIFYGEGKPKPLTEYLSEFLKEVRDLKNDNAFAFGRQCQLKFRYICDAPARAYIKCIVGHNSIHGCERCEQEGESVGHFTIYSSVVGPSRTNNSFLNGEDFSHHKGDSPLKDIGNVVARLSAANRRTLDANIEEVSPFLPCEFTRKGKFCVIDFLLWFDDADRTAKVKPMRETAVVPERWLLPNHEKCHWPHDFRESMLRGPADVSWPTYDVEVRGTYDSYPKARLKLSKACDTDNFESAAENEAALIRKRRKPTRFSPDSPTSTESEEDKEMAFPPKTTKENGDVRMEFMKKAPENQGIPSPPEIPVRVPVPKSTNSQRQTDGETRSDELTSPGPSCRGHQHHPSTKPSRESLKCIEPPSGRSLENVHQESTMQSSGASEGMKRCLQKILKNQEEIKTTLRAHSAILENICAHVGSESSAENFTKPQGWPSAMPLTDHEAFEKFEFFLGKKENFDFVTKYISLKCYSPKGYEEMSRNICRYIISRQLKVKLNWRGTEQKKGLCSTKTASVLTDAVLFKYPGSGSKAIAKAVSSWLRNNLPSSKKRAFGDTGNIGSDDDLGQE
ncbi:uncharacterized protein LOC124153204 [Ischnura elegans]|uniref:uncharacterized protein LOC124153204 n=1 Tax=Ischnura elegans TaxID=197161 RepID=UPI001ED868A1|nr:uncharacterized protein LOC124153204 [Ischnura elegans]